MAAVDSYFRGIFPQMRRVWRLCVGTDERPRGRPVGVIAAHADACLGNLCIATSQIGEPLRISIKNTFQSSRSTVEFQLRDLWSPVGQTGDDLKSWTLKWRFASLCQTLSDLIAVVKYKLWRTFVIRQTLWTTVHFVSRIWGLICTYLPFIIWRSPAR